MDDCSLHGCKGVQGHQQPLRYLPFSCGNNRSALVFSVTGFMGGNVVLDQFVTCALRVPMWISKNTTGAVLMAQTRGPLQHSDWTRYCLCCLRERHLSLCGCAGPWGRFRTARAQRGHSANHYGVHPGNTPANHPPPEACMIHSKQHRGCRIQDPGTRRKHQTKTKNPWCTSRGCGVQNSGPWDSWLTVVENSRLFAQRTVRPP